MRNFYILFLLLLPSLLFSQINDCGVAEVVCNNGNITFTPQGAGVDDFANPNNNSGCLATGEQSSAWYYFEVDANAPANQSLGFTITPTGGAGQDYDFALFGPDVPCSNLGNPIRCSYASSNCAFCPQTGLGMGANDQSEGANGDGFVSEITVQPGEGYFLLVDNFANNGVGFDLSWTGDASTNLDCNASPPCGLIADAGTPAVGCSGDIGLSLNGSSIGNSGSETYSWVGTNGSTAFLNDPTSPNPTLTIPQNVSGTFDFTLTVNDAACIDDDMVTVTINPLPTVTIIPPTAVCDDDNTFTLSASPMGGVWSANMPNGIVDPSTLGPGNYVVDYTYTDVNGCVNTDMTTVVINPSPTVMIDFFDTQLCTNDLPTFLTASPPGGTWSSNVPGGQLIPGNIGVGAWTITYNYIDANGCEGMDEVDINIFPEPVAVITDPGPLCDSGDPVFLTASPTGGVWGGNAIGGVFIPSNFGPGFYPVTYTYTEVFGCVTTTTFNVEVVSAPIADILPPPVLCTSSNPYTLTADPPGGTWGANTPNGIVDPTTLGVGQHTALYTFLDPTGCILVASETITVEGPPTVAITPTADLCVNGGTTTLTGSPAGGTWSANAPGGVFDPSIGSGNYNITYSYTDPTSGCSETANTTVNVVNEPSVGITGNGSFCSGTSTILTADTGFSNYVWSSGGSTNSISVNIQGTYTVTVTDGSGCTSTAEQLVTENLSLTPTITGDDAICSGASSTLDAGVFDMYNWSTGSTIQTTTVSASGTYTVTVTDAIGCTGTDEIIISTNNAPTPNIAGASTFCPNESSLLDAGVYADYIWSTGSTNQTINVSSTNTYTVTVTDGNGCTGTDEIVVSENTVTVPTISGTLSFCQNENTILDAGNTYTDYVWSNGSTTSTTTVSTGGNIGVTVTDGNGCTTEASVMVIENTPPTTTITGQNSICIGTSTTLDAGSGFSNYLWSTGDMTSTTTASTAGTYTVTVTDGNGCTATDEQVITQSASLTPTITGASAICSGASTTVDAGVFDMYIWSDGATTQTTTIAIPGTYTVTVTDVAGCTGTDEILISTNNAPTPNIAGADTFCPNETSLLDAGSYVDYIWSTGSTDQTITVSTTNTYTVTVTDGNGCTGTDEIIVSENTVTVPTISGTLSFCQNENTILEVGNTYTDYSWSNGSTTSTTTVSVGGNIGVTVTDGNGCTTEASVMVVENTPPTTTISGPTSICIGTSTTLDAGNGFSNYLWSTGEMTNTISANTAGTFTVTVTDGNGCTATDQVDIDITPNLQPTITGNLSICDGVLTTLNAGTGFTDYVWSTTEMTSSISTNMPGTYTVTVTDASGCTGTDQVAVSIAQGLSPTITGAPNFCNGTSTIIDAGVYDDYIWSDGSTNQTLNVTASGTYTVTVSDAAGCTGIDEMIVSEFPIPAPQISGSTSFCTGTSTILDAGTWIDYLWSDGSTGSSITVSMAGTYSVIITDVNGCTATTSVDVVESTSLNPTIVGNLSYCPNESTTLDAGFGFDSYLWSDGSMNQTLDVMTSGDYTVTVSDISGCTGTSVVSVAESIPPSANIVGQNSFCTGTSTTLDAESGYINYLWSDGSTNQTLDVNATGTYTVTVTDANGCTDETSLAVQELQSLDPMISGTDSFCEGSSTTISAVSGFMTYVWSDNSTSESIQVMDQGTYTVTVTDANGCTGSESILVSQNNNPIVNILGDNQFCPGTITECVATPGFVSYLWSDGSTNPTIPINIAGTYTVTVTDTNGCTGTEETTVNELATPSTTISGVPNFCPGESTNLSADAGFANYIWSDGTTNQNITADEVGTFTVTITDANGCTGESEITVSENIPPSPTIIGASSFCSGNSTILDATGNYTNYIWSNGSTDPTLTVSLSGTYTVTVTDASGCTGTTELAVSETTSLLPTFTGEQDFCQNESTVISAEAGYFTYAWSDGTMTEDITITNAGTYTLTVTDANGCTGENEISIIENTPPTPSIAGSTTFCIGFSTTLDAGNYDQYVWSDASTDPTLEVSTDGIFSVTVTDANGCTGVASTQVSESTQLEPVITGDDSFCSGSSSTLNAGAGFLTYVWSDANNSDSQSIDVSTPGTYSVTVSDASGCTGETSFIVAENIPVNAGTANPTTTLCSIDATMINLQNELVGADANGTWTETSLTPSIGNAFNPTNGTFNTDGQNSGTYTFEYFIAGPGTCPNDSEIVTIIVEQTPIAFIDQPIALDCNNPTVILDGTNSVGGSDLIYEWTLNGTSIVGADASTLVIDTEGTYDLIVSLPNGCSATTFIEMTEDFATPSVDAGMDQQLTCQNGEAILNGSSTTLGVIYTWSGPGITSANMNDQNPLVTSSGDYTLVVTNPQNGCESTTASVVVNADINAPSFTLDDVDPLDCNNTTQVLTGPFANNFAYQWFLDGNPIFGAINQEFEATLPGSYSLEITNLDNGCNSTEFVTVEESTDPPTAEAGTADLLTCTLGSVPLDGTGSSTGNVTYQWFDPNGNPIPNSNTLNIDATQQGTYTLLVTNDDNGCFATDEVIVDADNNFPTADAGTNTNLDCDFNSIQIGGNSSTGPNFTYSWTTQNGGSITNPTSANPSINQPGTYQLLVTDTDNGCTVIDAIVVSENTNVPVEIEYDLTPISCDGEDDGSLTILNVEGGTGPYTYSFNGAAFSNINSFPFLAAGDYSLEVTDALGCELETEVNLVSPPPFIIDLGSDTTIQLGESFQINTQFSQSYDSLWWRLDATLPCIDCPDPTVSPLQTTSYQATAINGNGCEDTDDITIIVEKKRNVYIPNVFSPNEDGLNDIFVIHGGIDVEKINVFKIYNRWGEQIFEKTNIQPDDFSEGWDGTFKGQKMNPAVFVYFAEIEFKDGRKVIYKGDVALRR